MQNKCYIHLIEYSKLTVVRACNVGVNVRELVSQFNQAWGAGEVPLPLGKNRSSAVPADRKGQ